MQDIVVVAAMMVIAGAMGLYALVVLTGYFDRELKPRLQTWFSRRIAAVRQAVASHLRTFLILAIGAVVGVILGFFVYAAPGGGR